MKIHKRPITRTKTPPIEWELPKAATPAPSELRFPFGKLAGWLVLFAVGGMFVYRLSQTGGRGSEKACLAAILVSGVAGVAGVIPVLAAWRRRLFWVVYSVFLSGAIRLLIGMAGVVIIIFFTAIERIEFVGYLALFYAVFMVADIWLSLWMTRHTAIKTGNRETRVHGNR